MARDLRVANAVRHRRRSGAWGWDEPGRAAEYRGRHAGGLYLARFREDHACVPPPANRKGTQEAAERRSWCRVSGGSSRTRLVVKRIPKVKLAATPVGEGTPIFELSEAQARYGKAEGWSLVSHTFKMPAEGSTVLS